MKKSFGADIIFPARVAVFRGAGRGVNRTLRSLPLFRNRPENSNRIADRNFSFDGGVSACFCSTDATAPTEFALRVVCPGYPPPVAGSSYNPFAATLCAANFVDAFTPVTDSIDSAWHLSFSCSAVAFTATTVPPTFFGACLSVTRLPFPRPRPAAAAFFRARLSTVRAFCNAPRRRNHAICRLFSKHYIFNIHALPHPGRSLPSSTAYRSGRHPAITLKSL